MAAPETRQRHPIATSHPYEDHITTTELHEKPPSLLSRWHSTRTNAPSSAQHAAMRTLELFLLSFALFLVPTTIQYFVRGIDSLYETVGRRTRTTFDDAGWWGVIVGAAMLAVWHAVLIALSYKTIARKQDGLWNRVLGRIVVPTYLLGAGGVFFYTLAVRLAAPVVVPVGYTDDEMATPYT